MVALGIAPERFVVAEGLSGEVLGMGQVEDKESGAYKEIRTLVVDPKARWETWSILGMAGWRYNTSVISPFHALVIFGLWFCKYSW